MGSPIIDHGLQLYDSRSRDLVVYSDVVWTDYPTSRQSTSSYCVFLGHNLLYWSSKRNDTISRSSAEAEYHGVVNVVVKTSWLLNLLREIFYPPLTSFPFYYDIVSVVYLSTNPV